MFLPDDDPITFNCFVQWLYKGSYTLPPNPSEESAENFMLPIRVLVFSDKYGIPALKICVLEALQIYFTGPDHVVWSPSEAAIKYAYDNTCRGSGIRRFLVHWYTYVGDEEWTNKEETQLRLIEIPEFAVDILVILNQNLDLNILRDFVQKHHTLAYTDEVKGLEGNPTVGGGEACDGSDATLVGNEG